MDWYPDLSVGTKLIVLYRSPFFLQTLLRNVLGLRVNVDSSLNATVAHLSMDEFLCKLAHRLRFSTWRGIKCGFDTAA